MDTFTCPISGQIFNDPVICADGYYYERKCIEQWLESNNTSPMTNQQLEHKNVSKSFEFNKRLQEFIKNNPDCDVYKPDYNYIELLNENKFDEFINTNIKDISINYNEIENINIFKNDILVKYFIDNNIKFTTNIINSKLIHFICRYSSPEMIKYILNIYVEKNLDLECETNLKSKPIHFICQHSTPEMIKYILDIYVEKGLNLECETIYKMKPIHFICQNSTPEMIKYILDIYKSQNLEYKQYLGRSLVSKLRLCNPFFK
jgi:hypothetical protein